MLGVAERTYIAAKIYGSLVTYFAHWQAVPGLDIEKSFEDLLSRAIAAPSRYEFDLLMVQFLGGLRNGHTSFSDEWLLQRHGQPLGFALADVESQKVVKWSCRTELAEGDIVETLGSSDIESFIESKLGYISASSRRAAEVELYSCPYLFPSTLKLKVWRSSRPRRVTIQRGRFKKRLGRRNVSCRRLNPGRVPYIAIPSFGDERSLRKAIEYGKKHRKAEALIVDVRGNGGGNTPGELIKLLMDRPYRGWRTETLVRIGVAGAYREAAQALRSESLPEYTRGFLDAGSSFAQSSLVSEGDIEEPEKDAFRGRLVILVDEECASACEDFVMPFKDSKRAIIVGRQTMGTSGQPYFYRFPNGMSFRVSAKRMHFPDGSQFEGVGIAPDVSVPLRIDDLRTGADPVLKTAMEVVTG